MRKLKVHFQNYKLTFEIVFNSGVIYDSEYLNIYLLRFYRNYVKNRNLQHEIQFNRFTLEKFTK
jgi:hypothetical protein